MTRKKKATLVGVQRPNSVKTYPTLEEREQIIERREKLLEKIISGIVMNPIGADRQIGSLMQEYGPQEVLMMLASFQKTTSNSELIGDDARVYRTYRQTFARFGGARRLLNRQELQELSVEHVKLMGKRRFMALIRRKPSARERELSDLLLQGKSLWEDITAPATPPRPPGYEVPRPRNYSGPAQALLTWGCDLDEQRIVEQARRPNHWRSSPPDLVEMALDPGLLRGWPGEPASWAPYHALHLLGRLKAHQYAGRLLDLLDQPDDWLSDRLPWAWAPMGVQAEPPLWAYLDDRAHDAEQRSVVLLGLFKIAEHQTSRWSALIESLIQRLRDAPQDDAQANAYIINILNRMQAVQAKAVIVDAFAQQKVDTSIFGPENVDFLD